MSRDRSKTEEDTADTVVDGLEVESLGMFAGTSACVKWYVPVPVTKPQRL